MKALILAAGQGKRLMPLTASTPKALVKFNEVTLLENILNVISSFHIEEIGIVIGYKGETIKDLIGMESTFLILRMKTMKLQTMFFHYIEPQHSAMMICFFLNVTYFFTTRQ